MHLSRCLTVRRTNPSTPSWPAYRLEDILVDPLVLQCLQMSPKISRLSSTGTATEHDYVLIIPLKETLGYCALEVNNRALYQ
jgi:hypothetical protein